MNAPQMPTQPAPAAAKAKKPASRKTRRISYLIHSFVGLKLTLLLSIVFLTGTLAVFAEEIDWLIYSAKRVTPQAEMLNPGEAFDRAKEQVTEGGLSGYSMPLGATRTAGTASLTLQDGGFRNVYIDPYTGEVTGSSNILTVGTFLSFMHATLFLPVIGRAFVNFFGILCVISLVTGIICYPKFWRHFFRMPRFNQQARVWLADMHRLLAIWSMWFLLIMGVTGTWWFYQNPLVFFNMAPQFLPEQVIPPAPSHEELAALGKKPQALSATEIVAKVQAHDPDLEITILTPPEHNGMAYSVWGTHRDLLAGNHSSIYYVQPFTGEILGDRLARDMPLLQRVDRAMRPLHYGTWGNSGSLDLIAKTIWFIFGGALTFLAISGLIMYYKRTHTAVSKLLPASGWKRRLHMTWLVVRPWGGSMSVFKYLNVGGAVFLAIGIGVVLTLASKGTAGLGYQYAEKRVGDWTISMSVIKGLLEAELDPIQAGSQSQVTAFFKDGDPAGVKFMYVKVNKPRTTRAPGVVIHGSVGYQHAHLPVPKKIRDGAELWLTIEDWEGNFYQASWPLMPDGVNTIDTRTQNVAAAESSTSAAIN